MSSKALTVHCKPFLDTTCESAADSWNRYAATAPEIEEKGWNGYYFGDVVSFRCSGCHDLLSILISY